MPGTKPRPRRKRAHSPITEEHFRLLKQYGRNPLSQQISKREAAKLWEMVCETGRVPHVKHDKVVEEWKRYITGQSRYSGIAINADIDPQLTTLAFTHQERLTAGHTTRTDKLLDKLLELFAKCFPSRESFLNSMEKKCLDTAKKTWSKP